MATSYIPKDNPLQVYQFRNFSPASGTSPTSDELLAALNAVKTLIPAPGIVVLIFGNDDVTCRCVVFASLTNYSRGRATVLSPYSSIDNLRLKLDSSTNWSLVT